MGEIVELVPIGQGETDGQVVKMWLYQKSRRSQGTARLYEHEFNRFREICNRPLAALRISDLQLYQERLEELGLARASQARALSTIRSLFTFARKIGYLQFNPAEVMDLPKVIINSEGHFLTPGEVQALLDALRPQMRNYLIGALQVSAALAQRSGEADKQVRAELGTPIPDCRARGWSCGGRLGWMENPQPRTGRSDRIGG